MRETEAAMLARHVRHAPAAALSAVKDMQDAIELLVRGLHQIQADEMEDAAFSLADALLLICNAQTVSETLWQTAVDTARLRKNHEQRSVGDVVPPLPTA